MASRASKVVHKRFEEQAVATPDAPAVVFEEERLGYAELNARANRLATRLIRSGVTRGDLIGLCLERSSELVVALLGILKAGAAYVPLDPAYPDERLAFMIRDTAARVVVGHGPTRARLAPFAQTTTVLCLDTDANAPAGEPAENPDLESADDDLVYVMYTSGSTGTPKGVLVRHRGVVRLVRDTDYCCFGPGEVFLHLAPLAFDASTFEIWGPLLNGGSLAIMAPGPPTPDAVGATIRRHGVTTLWLTAGLFHLIVEQRVEALEPLRQLVAGGDVLSPGHVGRALEAMRDGVLINGYGPTESTTFACCHRMEKGCRLGNTIPIGRPIANTTVQILDPQLQPVPAGTPGELCIGGDGLARGYLNSQELTREKFVADPSRKDPNARLYRTGDRARYREDGNLEFLGRLDNQVKILGRRIEPGEIEATLRLHPNVGQAVVVARSQPRGDKQLVAYVVAASPAGLTADALKLYLADRLPHYMVPAHVVLMDRLPLNPNGKVDQAALPAPDLPTPAAENNRPLSNLEHELTLLWRKILGRPVGPNDNFFDLGGTSLQVLEVHAELTRTLHRPLAVTALFEHATIRALAGWLAGSPGHDRELGKVRDRAARQKRAFAQQSMARGSRA
jgi:amino acid adenylation domain-containing protein